MVKSLCGLWPGPEKGSHAGTYDTLLSAFTREMLCNQRLFRDWPLHMNSSGNALMLHALLDHMMGRHGRRRTGKDRVALHEVLTATVRLAIHARTLGHLIGTNPRRKRRCGSVLLGEMFRRMRHMMRGCLARGRLWANHAQHQ